MKISVPGRVCLFGEHSDWAGGHRRTNAEITPGLAIIAGTNQGLHAQVQTHPTLLRFRVTLPDGTRMEPFEVPMERKALLDVARQGGFFSYAAGVAHQVMTHYRVQGLEIDNYRTDLPVRKGLSSSAAVCVLVARAFNRLYDLKLTVRGEMEMAYLGETTTPSRCGRLDQGCAFGPRPVLMHFDGDRIDVEELSVAKPLHFAVVDLCASKDTREILNKLNHCYPFADDPVQKDVQRYLGPVNQEIVTRAAACLRKGDAAGLGALMNEAQAQFDRMVAPACPGQLAAPVLHRLLSHPSLQPHIHGGKGVGSQGDGSAQLLARDAAALDRIVEIVQNDLGMPCLKLVLQSAQRVRKAVIPAAGFGTRLFPATKAVKKELFPVVDRTGRAKPVILCIVEEALSAGIEEVCILVQSADKQMFEEIFCRPPPIGNLNKLSQEDRRYCESLMDIGRRITFVAQDVQEGFGHAVFCAREWVGSEPFLLLLGDHLYSSETPRSCARQLIDVFDRTGRSVVGLMPTPGSDVHHYGTVGGTWQQGGQWLDIREFAEKPTIDYARGHLRVADLPEDSFLTVFGQYVLKSEVFAHLEENISNNLRERGEFQLTSCLERMRAEEGFIGCRVDGRRYDIGNPAAYLRTVGEYVAASPCAAGTAPE